MSKYVLKTKFVASLIWCINLNFVLGTQFSRIGPSVFTMPPGNFTKLQPIDYTYRSEKGNSKVVNFIFFETLEKNLYNNMMIISTVCKAILI